MATEFARPLASGVNLDLDGVLSLTLPKKAPSEQKRLQIS